MRVERDPARRVPPVAHALQKEGVRSRPRGHRQVPVLLEKPLMPFAALHAEARTGRTLSPRLQRAVRLLQMSSSEFA